MLSHCLTDLFYNYKVSLDDLGLSPRQRTIFKQMVGPRYDPRGRGGGSVRLVMKRFPNRLENKRFAVLTLERLIAECKRLDAAAPPPHMFAGTTVALVNIPTRGSTVEHIHALCHRFCGKEKGAILRIRYEVGDPRCYMLMATKEACETVLAAIVAHEETAANPLVAMKGKLLSGDGELSVWERISIPVVATAAVNDCMDDSTHL